MAKKTIGLVSHDFYPYQGGLGRHATTLLRELNAHLAEFEVIGISPLENDLPDHVSSLRFTKKLPADQIQFSLFYQFLQTQLVRKLKLNAIILNGGPGGVFCIRKPEVPLVYIANHTYAQQSTLVPGESWKRCFIPLEKKGFGYAKTIVAISSTTQKSLRDDYNIPEEKITVVPPGFHFDAEPNSTLPTGNDFLFVGRLDERKGVQFLLEAFARDGEKLSPGKLHIIGTGKDDSKLRSFANSSCKEQVLFHGFLADELIEKIAANCCAQVIPSRLEGFGLVAVESIKRGLPVIASESAGLSDIVVDGHTGSTFPYGDHGALIAACSYAQKHPEEMRSRATNAFHDVKERLNWEVITRQYNEIFCSLFTH